MAPEQNAIDAALAAVGHKTAQVGMGTTVWAWLVSSEGGVAIGILIGVVGLAVQFYYRRKQDRREEAEHELRMLLRRDQHEMHEHRAAEK